MDKPVVSGGQKIFSSNIQIKKSYKKKPYTIYGKKLYSKLIPSGSQYYHGLLDDYRKEDLIGHLVILYTRRWEQDVDYLYGYFDSYVEFYEYYKQFPVKDRCFYEIINFYQKPHFDIDIGYNKVKNNYFLDQDLSIEKFQEIAKLLIETIIKSCKITMLPNELSLEKDVLIYTSHGYDHKKQQEKLSYHIILDNWSHFDNIEAKSFYDKVSRLTQCFLNGRYCEFLDEKVYSENQAFRLLGSHKVDDQRIKKLQESFEYENKIIHHQFDEYMDNLKEMNHFSKSLITFTSGCKLLQSFKVDKIYKQVKQYDLSEKDVNEITGFLNLKFKDQFRIREIKVNKINLVKTRPYYCSLCQRVHPNENPRIVVYTGIVYWQCRRSYEKLIIGYLSSYNKEKEEIDDEDDDTGNFLSFGEFKIDLTIDDENYKVDVINEKINMESENYMNNYINDLKNDKQNKSPIKHTNSETSSITSPIKSMSSTMNKLSSIKRERKSMIRSVKKVHQPNFSTIINEVTWGQ